jgi:Glucose-6-phosphate dehydrogenase, NAD binding domain
MATKAPPGRPTTTTREGPLRPDTTERGPHTAAPAPGGRTIRDERLAQDGKRRKPARPTEANPLRKGLRLERVPDPHVMVLFGATGDLSHRKVIPALAQLWRTNLLPQDWMLVAIGRRQYDDASFRDELRTTLRANARVALEPSVEKQFLQRVSYHRGDFDDDATYASLIEKLDAIDRGR